MGEVDSRGWFRGLCACGTGSHVLCSNLSEPRVELGSIAALYDWQLGNWHLPPDPQLRKAGDTGGTSQRQDQVVVRDMCSRFVSSYFGWGSHLDREVDDE